MHVSEASGYFLAGRPCFVGCEKFDSAAVYRIMDLQAVLIFAYGSNMDLEQMRERCPHSDLASFVAEARGWKLCFPRKSVNRKGGVGSIEEKEGSSVWGVVFSVSQMDVLSLDRYEGVPIGAYTRGPLEVQSGNGEVAQVQAYFAVRQQQEDFAPHKNYMELYVRGAKRFGLPAAYIEFLESIKDTKSD